jgi:ribose 5-phosphate isomerase RpiB
MCRFVVDSGDSNKELRVKIAIVNETSSADKNADIVAALEGRGHEILNMGMFKTGAEPALSYVDTGLLTAILLNARLADFVVGGCGTGQGYAIAAMQYPGVFCGHVRDSMDAWLFTQINGGNCISLALNQGYGWAADVNLRFIFDRIFSVERGGGYPAHRREAQKKYRLLLESLSAKVHPGFAQVIDLLPDEVLGPVLRYPTVPGILDLDRLEDRGLREALRRRLPGGARETKSGR